MRVERPWLRAGRRASAGRGHGHWDGRGDGRRAFEPFVTTKPRGTAPDSAWPRCGLVQATASWVEAAQGRDARRGAAAGGCDARRQPRDGECRAGGDDSVARSAAGAPGRRRGRGARAAVVGARAQRLRRGDRRERRRSAHPGVARLSDSVERYQPARHERRAAGAAAAAQPAVAARAADVGVRARSSPRTDAVDDLPFIPKPFATRRRRAPPLAHQPARPLQA